ncbi:MAG: hypothetical protein D6788_09850, partial [Planctomycetota bacterium]
MAASLIGSEQGEGCTMKRTRVMVGFLALGLIVAPALTLAPGCGGNDFLGLEDYQRDLLTGALAAALLGSTPSGGGINCWDLNGNGVNDPEEDVNNDGAFNALDCVAGAAGLELPNDGISCWDLNENGQADPEEDVNGDGVVDVADCRGADGADGAAGPAGPAGPAGADGLNCWDLNGNGVRDPEEDTNGDGVWDARDCQGAAGPSGPSGPAGPSGADGPEFFDVWVDDFFTANLTTASGLGPFLPVVAVLIDEPILDPSVNGPIAYRVAIPPRYQVGNDVTMRLFLYRTGFSEGDCFVMTLDARRLRNEGTVEVYGDDCSGLPAPDCGRRWIRVEDPAPGADGVLLVIDLPLNTAAGLDLERDLSGAERLAPGDFLAFEINKSDKSDDTRLYQVLGA